MRSRVVGWVGAAALLFCGRAAELEARPRVGNVDTLLHVYERWEEARTGRGDASVMALPIGYAKGLSARLSGARGYVTLDLGRGRIALDLAGVPDRAPYALWLVDNVAAPGSSARPEEFDPRVFVGLLEPESDGTIAFSGPLPPEALLGFTVDRVVVTAAEDRPERGLLFASPSLFQRIFFRERRERLAYAGLVPAPGGATALALRSESRRELFEGLVEEGEALFFEETFSGNGRTCGTCHPTANNFTIDPRFIRTLPADDPLFVAEFDSDLAELENPTLMRDFGLILENVDGFEDPTEKFVMRSVPHILGLANTIVTDAGLPPLQATGWSGDGAPESGTLRDFAIGAVNQHFPQTLARVDGSDFRLPTETELDELEAFQLSVGRSRELEITTMTLMEPDAEAGRVTFVTTDSDNGTVQAGKCIVCHDNAGALALDTGFNDNFDTGVETVEHPADATGEPFPIDGGFGSVLNPVNGGFGDGSFNPPSLVEAADTGPFFHNNLAVDLNEAVDFYATPEFGLSPAAIELQNLDTGGQTIQFDRDEIVAFLAVLNTLENIRSAIAYAESAILEPVFVEAAEIIGFALADLVDAGEVLFATGLHEDEVPFLALAFNAFNNAQSTIDQTLRNTFLEGGVNALRASQPRFVVPRVVFVSHEEGEPVSGTITLEAEVLDVDTRGMLFEVDGEPTCIARTEPFRCDWDTTEVGNGSHTITATTLDFQNQFTESEIELVVAN